MTIPRRRPRQRMGVRDVDAGKVPAFRAYVRQRACCVPGCVNRDIEAAHRRAGIPNDGRGGEGMKPHDKWCFPACGDHHRQQHKIGEYTFERLHGIDTMKIAEALWRAWPGRQKWEQKQAERLST